MRCRTASRIPALLCLLCPVLAGFFLGGCTRLLEREALHLADRNLRQAEDVRLVAGDLALFRQCFEQRGGACSGTASTALLHSAEARQGRSRRGGGAGESRILAAAIEALPAGHPARDAYRALGHPVTTRMSALHDLLRGHEPRATPGVSVEAGESRERGAGVASPPESLVRLELGFRELDELTRLLFGSLGGHGFEHLQELCKSLARKTRDASEAERTAFDRACRGAAFVREYLAAYFRHGRIVGVTLDTRGLAEEVDQAASRLEGRLQDLGGEVEKLDRAIDRTLAAEATRIDASLSKVFRVDSSGFVSRDTTYSAKVPSFEPTFDPTAGRALTLKDLDTGQPVGSHTRLDQLGIRDGRSGARISNELVRVFLEALFDAAEGLPALAPQNGPPATGLAVGPWSLPLFQPPMGKVDTADWNAMLALNAQVEANVRAVLSRVVAGIGPFSLNNPALEYLIVEILSTTVRKAAEKATWCWYSCGLDEVLHREEAKLRARLDAEEKKLGGEVERSAERAGRALEGYGHDLAERVRLRLELRE